MAGTPRTKTARSPRATQKRNGKLRSINPRTGEVLAEIPANSPGEIADIVANARKVAPEWAAIPPEGRARILREVRYRIHDKMDEIVDIVSTESGKPGVEALNHDVLPPALMLLYFERITARTLRPEKVGRLIGPLLAGSSSRIEWRPFGVVGCITPWNYPILNCFLAFIPALFAGNVVVIKPSEVTPRCGEVIRDLLEPLPAGVATVIQGGGDVGAALVDAPCDKISFIGSPPTGRKICDAAAKHLTPVVMELGGKDAAIVCDDADLETTSSGILWAAFANAGQTCCSIERTYVVDSVADSFNEKLLGKLGRIKQGDGGEIGPLTFARQLEIVQRHVSDAVGKGAKVLAGGAEAGVRNKDGSLWYAPTVLTDVKEDMDVAREETFGPVLTITRVGDEEEAVRRANEDGVNLTASVWTTDAGKARRIAARLRSGSVSINTHMEGAGIPWSPWGGAGESGFGRLNGKQGLREFTIPVHVQENATPKLRRLWWYPYDDAQEKVVRALAETITAPKLGAKAKALGAALKNLRKALKSKI